MAVIETALAQCAQVIVLSYSVPEFAGCEASRRERWLRTLFPRATILVVDDVHMPPNHAPDDVHRLFCARLLRDRLHSTVDAVFTSEDYGDGLASTLSAQLGSAVMHVCVDRARAGVPISGTQLRADVHTYRTFLHPEVYSDFVGRVCFLGAESSGKSTLATALAAEFDTTHAPEFGRELSEA
ncbi:MAG TPA: AAA family ATPase, partial [Gemmatimonadaceae bacterium]|nr:AAA family ATPase [Gemmatimonadaceae bacterium]